MIRPLRWLFSCSLYIPCLTNACTGDHTLNIFIFHIISYKVVSLLKIWYYGLDPRQIGCHMVIHDYSQQDLFWILYTFAGVGIPLLGTWLSELVKARIREYRASSGSQVQ